MTTPTLSVTETASNFSDAIDSFYHHGNTYGLARGNVIVERMSQPEKRLTSAELAAQWDALPLLSQRDADEWLAEYDEMKQNEPKIGNGVWQCK